MIEPCLYCGSEMERKYWTQWFHECPYCGSTVATDVEEEHNRLSRIVRAAEDWVREEKIPGNLSKIQEAEDALRNAVEGGRADG